MKRRSDLDKAKSALAAAEKQRDEIKEQRPLVEAEARSLSWLLAENNFAARWRRALTGE